MMRRALTLAQTAADAGEVPVGAVVYDAAGGVLGEGHNAPIARCDPTAHAEIIALRQAAAAQGNYRLSGLHIAVSLEPCPMCAAAIFHARLACVVFAAPDAKGGALGGVVDLSANPAFNHQTRVRNGLYADDAAALLQEFFRHRRASSASPSATAVCR